MKSIETIQSEFVDIASALNAQPYTSVWGDISAASLMERAPEALDCLIEPILPRVGIAALIGSSDSGKSSFLRTLAMHCVAGEELFLGFRVAPKHHKVVYVSTEDEENSVSVLVKRQAQELGYSPSRLEGLKFLFETEDLFERLESIVTAEPCDMVIIDAFSDLYTGGMNDNNQVRNFLNKFRDFATQHSLLVLFLHHTGKRTESYAPSKHNAIGSQGFEAKMRFVAELRRDPDPDRATVRHLCIVKGNYLPPEFKRSSFELNFTQGLNFTLTGNRVNFENLRERTEEELRANDNIETLRRLKSEGLNLRQISEQTGIPIATVHRKLRG